MTRNHPLHILVLTKRQYTNKDLIDDRYGRIREIPLHLARNGYSVRGLCLSYRKKEAGFFRDECVLWESINAGPFILSGWLKFVLRTMRLAADTDIIWACSDSLFGITALCVGRIFGVPVVFDLYDNFESFLPARLPVLKALYRHAVRNCDAVTVVSQPLFELVRSYGRTGELHLIENAVDQEIFFPQDKAHCRSKFKLPQRKRIIGTAGSLSKSRGIQTLYQAFEMLARRHPDIHLALAGRRDTPTPAHPRVHDLGHLEYNRMPHFFSSLDIGIICNRASAFGTYCFPQKAREMMACNVPLVAANVEGTKSLFSNHPEWLFNPDDPDHLTQAIENRLQDRSTDYTSIPTWADMAGLLEKVILKFTESRIK
jgi:glycosyltransferase involved in cell wall biosynthesis